MRKLILASALALSLAACASVGHPFAIDNATVLVPGVSTEADAIAMLGEPVTFQSNPLNGHHLLIWQYIYGTGFGTGGGAKLAISFDASGHMLQIIQRSKV